MQPPGSHVLPSLLAMLNDKKPGSSITSVVNAATIDLICNLLSMDPKCYIKIAEQLRDTSDVNNMLNFILCLVCNGHLFNPNAILSDANWRARRLMIKVIAKTPVIPTSLIVVGVSMPAERDYIGGGGFGHVYKGELGGTAVALKVLYKANNSVAFCQEALMWRSLTHKFVLPFLGIYEIEGGTVPQFFLVSPYMKNGTLAQWRKKKNPSIAKIEERIMEVAQGIEYIHAGGAVHGDLRGDNILLDANFQVQIADFGLTRLSEATATRSGAVHVNFAAPELFDSPEDDDNAVARTQKSDVYAFGCLHYEIHYDMIPFFGKTEMQILKLIFQGARPPRRDQPPLNDNAWELIQRCWATEASERPRMKDVAKWMVTVPTMPQASFSMESEAQSFADSGLTSPNGNRGNGDEINGTHPFVALQGNTGETGPSHEIERLYQCSWQNCTRAYGTLSQLNAHVTMKKHGPKRSPGEFKELRKQQRRAKKDVAMEDEPVGILPGLRNAPEQTPSEDVAMEDEQVNYMKFGAEKRRTPSPSATSVLIANQTGNDYGDSITLPAQSSPTSSVSREFKSRKDALAKQLPLQRGTQVAFHPGAMSVGGADVDENMWILAHVTGCFIVGEHIRYEVQDAEPQEDGQPGLLYTTSLRSIVPLPDPTASPADINSYQEFPAGSTVMARYPDTSCFYRAEVRETPKDLQRWAIFLSPMYKLKFEDVNHEHLVAAQWVVEWPGKIG